MPNKSHPSNPHPDEWQQDLNPNFMAGQNHGIEGSHTENEAPTAYDIKEAHAHPLLQDLADDELKRITILPQGTRLEQGATYLDLRLRNPKEFKGMGNMEVGPHNWYVPKSSTDYPLWNRLIGVTMPERLDEESGA